jgi:hypothetical protein
MLEPASFVDEPLDEAWPDDLDVGSRQVDFQGGSAVRDALYHYLAKG